MLAHIHAVNIFSFSYAVTANSSVLVVYHWCCSGANVLGCCTCTSTGQYVVHVLKQQSRVEIDHYSIAYFDHITAFEAL